MNTNLNNTIIQNKTLQSVAALGALKYIYSSLVDGNIFLHYSVIPPCHQSLNKIFLNFTLTGQMETYFRMAVQNLSSIYHGL